MTERIARLVAQAFRGVPRQLVVEFPNGRSAVVFGDNATGKSTIADALEWYFTGRIELLAHEGRERAIRHLSAASHLPTRVEVTTTGNLGGAIVHPVIDVLDVHAIGRRETFLLRGRTLADFVNKTKAEKWKALAEIMGLDAVDRLRLDLQRARNELKSAARTAEETLAASVSAVAPRVGEVSEREIFSAIASLCAQAGVDPPDSLERALDPAWSRSVTGNEEERIRAVRMTSLAQDIESVPRLEYDEAVIVTWNGLIQSPEQVAHVRLRFFNAAQDLLARLSPVEECPLCGQSVEHERLDQIVRGTLMSLEEAARRFDSAAAQVSEVADRLTAADGRRRALSDQARALSIELPPLPDSPESNVRVAIRRHETVDLQSVRAYSVAISEWDRLAKAALRAAVPPAPTPREAVLVALGTLVEQARKWRSAAKAADAATRAHHLADRVFSVYQARQGEYVGQILNEISARVAGLYGRLHPGEGLGGVTIEPWTDKGIELAVEFYGSKQKPPHGVLSESHLNSLGIAVFLAMGEAFNERLRFLVLDDVVNSFDLEHRGQLAEMLVEEFGDWQLIVLTHDHQFYSHLARRAPSWVKLEFTSWTYDEGPRTTEYETGTMLENARRALESGDTNAAATKARRALEELLQETCEGLGAPLAFRRGVSNDRREIGELFSGLRHILKRNAKELHSMLGPLLTNLEADVHAALNIEAHAGRGRAAEAEVRASLDRIGELDRAWTCESCHSRVWAVGGPEASRCKCGRKTFPPIAAD